MLQNSLSRQVNPSETGKRVAHGMKTVQFSTTSPALEKSTITYFFLK